MTLKMKLDEMTDDQNYCALALDKLIGIHNLSGIESCGEGIQVNISHGLSTFDGNLLTRLVLTAHQWHIRFEILPCNMQYMRLTLHRRKKSGSMFERHPGVTDLIKYATEMEKVK